jgi:hypothetical protein
LGITGEFAGIRHHHEQVGVCVDAEIGGTLDAGIWNGDMAATALTLGRYILSKKQQGRNGCY